MRRLIPLMLSALSMAPMLAASGATADELNRTAWTLAELPGHTLLPDHPATLRLADGRAQGSDGCNRYSASYQAEGDRFQVAPSFAGTRMACAEPLMQQAQAFLAALTGARAAHVEGGRLVLRDDAGRVLAILARQSQELAGTGWHVTGYNNGKQAVVSVLNDTSLTLQFEADGKIAGSAGCNRYTGSYSGSGDKLALGKVAATHKMCVRPQRIMEQEAAFLKALQRVASSRIDANRLELRDARGALLVTASRAPPAGQ